MNFDRLTSYLDSLRETEGIPGSACLVLRDHKTVYSHTEGFSDAAGTMPVTLEDQYLLYSATKPLTAVAAMQLVEGDVKRVDITENNLKELLGTQQYSESIHSDRDQVGVVNGLAWTQVGGEILEVEAQALDGSGKLELTGNLGSVMQESAKAALTCLRSRWEELGLPRDFYKTKDIHVHFPEGAVPKDGPSAGIAMATALLSALTNRKIKAGIAMTGEVTLRGRVLPIGGLKEKTMAAKRYGIHTVLIPKDNARDLEEIDQTVRAALRFVPVETVDQVFAEVFCPSRVETKADAIPAFLPVENSKEAALRQ